MSTRRGGDDEDQGVIARLLARLTRLEAERDQLNAEIDRLKRHAMAEAELRSLMGAGVEFSPAADGTGPLPTVRSQGPRTAGHRRERPPWLRVVPGFVPLAAFAKQGWGWAASHTAATVTGATAVTAVVAGAGIVTLATPPATAHPAHPATLPPAAGLWTATPITSPAGKPKAAVARDGHLITAVPSPPYPYATAPPSSAAPARSSPAPQPAVVMQGTLDITETTVTLRPGVLLGELSGTLTLTATGGPVSWTASAPGLSLDTSGGTIPTGQTVVVTVSVPLGQLGGSGTVTLEPGGVQVQVSWLPGLPAGLPSSLGL